MYMCSRLDRPGVYECQNTARVLNTCLFSWVENEKIISQIIGVCEVCDQNDDSVSKNDKSCRIYNMLLKCF